MDIHGVDIVLFGRVVERLIVTISALLSIVMGWNLFRVGVVDAQSFDITKENNWGIRVSKIGPGVVFAALGAGILWVNLINPISLKFADGEVIQALAGGDGKRTTGVVTSISLYGNQGAEGLEIAKAINTLEQNLEAVESTEDRKTSSAKAMQIMIKIRDTIILTKFGAPALALYKSKSGIYQTHPEQLSEEDKNTIKALLPYLEETL